MNANAPLTTDVQQDRRRKRKAILAGGMVLGLGAAVTLAAWSDDVFANEIFTTGSFELQGSTDGTTFSDNDTADVDAASLTFAMAPTDIAPGDVNYASFWLGVEGTQDALITIPSVTGTAASAGLNAQLGYAVYTGAAECDADGIVGADLAYSGAAIDGAAATIDPLNQVTAPQLPTEGAGGVELCIAVTANSDQELLPQGESTTVTWQFEGTSVDGS